MSQITIASGNTTVLTQNIPYFIASSRTSSHVNVFYSSTEKPVTQIGVPLNNVFSIVRRLREEELDGNFFPGTQSSFRFSPDMNEHNNCYRNCKNCIPSYSRKRVDHLHNAYKQSNPPHTRISCREFLRNRRNRKIQIENYNHRGSYKNKKRVEVLSVQKTSLHELTKKTHL